MTDKFDSILQSRLYDALPPLFFNWFTTEEVNCIKLTDEQSLLFFECTEQLQSLSQNVDNGMYILLKRELSNDNGNT